MQPNLGYLYYKDIYKVDNSQLVTNTTAKDDLLKRELTKEEKEPFFKTTNFSLVTLTKEEKEPFFKTNNFSLVTTYPGFTTGSGMPHGIKNNEDDFKIGFYFDHTTGLPIIPGSSVKGVLRSVFPNYDKDKSTPNDDKDVKTKWLLAQIASIDKDTFLTDIIQPKEINETDFTEKDFEKAKSKIIDLELEIFEGIKNNKETDTKKKYFSIYKRDIFHDAIIIKEGKDKKIIGTDFITPHIKEDKSYEESMLSNPTPLAFLKVLPNVTFQFNFDLKTNGDSLLTATHKELLFKKILLTIGIGAKTNVGYGQFILDKVDYKTTEKTTENQTEKRESNNYNKNKGKHFPNSNKKDYEEKSKYQRIAEAQPITQKNKELEVKEEWINTFDLKVNDLISATVILVKSGTSQVQLHVKNDKIILNLSGNYNLNQTLIVKVKEVSGKIEKGNFSITKIEKT